VEQYKQKGTVISYYVPDDYVLYKIRQKCQEEDRSVSQWSYRIIRRALSKDNLDDIDNKENGLQGATGLGKHQAAAAEEPIQKTGAPEPDNGT
jgi:hypothetical protein